MDEFNTYVSKQEADEYASARLRYQSLRQIADAVQQYAEWHGGIHDDDCPSDDTCACSGKPINDGVNAACRYLEALAVIAQNRAASEYFNACIAVGEDHLRECGFKIPRV
jgi:hypothetical protein